MLQGRIATCFPFRGIVSLSTDVLLYSDGLLMEGRAGAGLAVHAELEEGVSCGKRVKGMREHQAVCLRCGAGRSLASAQSDRRTHPSSPVPPSVAYIFVDNQSAVKNSCIPLSTPICSRCMRSTQAPAPAETGKLENTSSSTAKSSPPDKRNSSRTREGRHDFTTLISDKDRIKHTLHQRFGSVPSLFQQAGDGEGRAGGCSERRDERK